MTNSISFKELQTLTEMAELSDQYSLEDQWNHLVRLNNQINIDIENLHCLQESIRNNKDDSSLESLCGQELRRLTGSSEISEEALSTLIVVAIVIILAAIIALISWIIKLITQSGSSGNSSSSQANSRRLQDYMNQEQQRLLQSIYNDFERQSNDAMRLHEEHVHQHNMQVINDMNNAALMNPAPVPMFMSLTSTEAAEPSREDNIKQALKDALDSVADFDEKNQNEMFMHAIYQLEETEKHLKAYKVDSSNIEEWRRAYKQYIGELHHVTKLMSVSSRTTFLRQDSSSFAYPLFRNDGTIMREENILKFLGHMTENVKSLSMRVEPMKAATTEAERETGKIRSVLADVTRMATAPINDSYTGDDLLKDIRFMMGSSENPSGVPESAIPANARQLINDAKSILEYRHSTLRSCIALLKDSLNKIPSRRDLWDGVVYEGEGAFEAILEAFVQIKQNLDYMYRGSGPDAAERKVNKQISNIKDQLSSISNTMTVFCYDNVKDRVGELQKEITKVTLTLAPIRDRCEAMRRSMSDYKDNIRQGAYAHIINDLLGNYESHFDSIRDCINAVLAEIQIYWKAAKSFENIDKSMLHVLSIVMERWREKITQPFIKAVMSACEKAIDRAGFRYQ